jgi:hypothetical protein
MALGYDPIPNSEPILMSSNAQEQSSNYMTSKGRQDLSRQDLS